MVAQVETFWLFSPLDKIGGIPQTAVKFQSKVDIKGVGLPSQIMNSVAKRYGMQVRSWGGVESTEFKNRFNKTSMKSF